MTDKKKKNDTQCVRTKKRIEHLKNKGWPVKSVM